jgi:S-adenosylmethionine-diacylglycerol 3-amino-3-carboxypropyl transferase
MLAPAGAAADLPTAGRERREDDGAPRRRTLPGARDGRLFFAQVREDPLLEIEALAPGSDDTVIVIGSGGCTALSLVAAGAGRVVAVDINRTQNHLLELKAVAGAALSPGLAVAFLGGAPVEGTARLATYARFRRHLSPAARAYWDARPRALRRGVIGAGVSEQFVGLVCRGVRAFVHSPARCSELLASPTLATQREFYRRVWNTRRWRGLFAMLLNRWVFIRAYEPAFFRHVQSPSFARHFHRTVEHGLTEVPVASNYFLHQMLTGFYPAGVEHGLPPYLGAAGSPAMARGSARLEIIDGAITDYLRGQPDASIDGFALSNICEWLTPEQIDALFGEIVRTATPGARLCFRNFVGWTEVPVRWRGVVEEDRARGERMMRRERSLVQRRFVPCRIRKAAS